MNEIANNADANALGVNEEGALERRLFRVMCVAVALAFLICVPLAPWRVTAGLLLGGALSLLNFQWMRSSLAALLGSGQTKKRGRIRKAARYVLRYFVIAFIIFAAYR